MRKLKIIKGILFIVLSGLFATVNLYTIHEIVNFEWANVPTYIYQTGYWADYFGSFFERTNANIWIAMVVFGLGIIEIIEGVKKNGN